MIELHDLVGANDLRFSPYCWRSKAVLAYKNRPYTTVPVRFTDKDKIAFSGQERVPVLKENGATVSDSWTIAGYLEDRHSEPRLFPGPGLKEACRFFNLSVDRVVHPACLPVIITDIFARIDPADREYFRASREQRFGMTLEAIAAQSTDARAKRQIILADLEAALAGQAYFFGLLTYADFCLFGTCKWITAVSDAPLFTPGSPLQAWWERIHEQLGIKQP